VQFAGPFKIYANPFRIKAEGRKPIHTGELVTPVAVQVSGSPDQVGISRAVDGSGLADKNSDGLLEHSSKPADMWLTEKGQTTGSIEFDLGKAHKLDLIQIWNFNEKWHTNRGIKKADISIWTESKGWQKVFDDFQVDEADGSDDYDEPALAKLGGVQAQKIRFDDLANLGDAEYVGLSEVRFSEAHGPAAVRPQPADGTTGIGLGGLALAWTPGLGAVAHNLYFGTDANNLQLLGRLEGAGDAKLSRLASGTKYYWRVDEIQADGSAAKGKVWSFQTGGLLAWWKLDETEGASAADSSGNALAGKLMGNPQWQPSGGKVGGALEFDGADDYVETNYATDLPVWTVAVWVKSPAAPSLGPPSGPVHREKNYQLNWNHASEDFRGVIALSIGGKWHTASFGKLEVDTWYHLVATYDGQDLKAYKHGVLITNNSAPSGVPDAESATLKFAKHAMSGYYFRGTIDDVRIYSCALSEAEVAALYSGKAMPAVAKVILETPVAKIGSEKPPAEGRPSAAPGQEEPGRGKNWIPVLIIVVIVGVVVAFATLRKKSPT
jgi:hypothetical protein